MTAIAARVLVVAGSLSEIDAKVFWIGAGKASVGSEVLAVLLVALVAVRVRASNGVVDDGLKGVVFGVKSTGHSILHKCTGPFCALRVGVSVRIGWKL